jgi:hypothetical protein
MKFKFLLNVNLNNFILEHATDTKILSLVPLDHRNIFQAHWANLKALDLAFNMVEEEQLLITLFNTFTKAYKALQNSILNLK